MPVQADGNGTGIPGSPPGYCYKEQPEWSAYRESSFGHGTFDAINATHALWSCAPSLSYLDLHLRSIVQALCRHLVLIWICEGGLKVCLCRDSSGACRACKPGRQCSGKGPDLHCEGHCCLPQPHGRQILLGRPKSLQRD